MVQPLTKTVRQLLTELHILLPYDSAIVLLGIYPKEMKIYLHKNLHMDMFIAAFFRSPTCPSVGE